MKRNTIISNFGVWQMLLNITKSADLQIWLIQLADYIEYAFIPIFSTRYEDITSLSFMLY